MLGKTTGEWTAARNAEMVQLIEGDQPPTEPSSCLQSDRGRWCIIWLRSLSGFLVLLL